MLTRYRWSLPVMAELWESDGCKFITLVRRLNASDKAVRQALDYLIAEGWVMRNPGYGHPWRPEYILTDDGVAPGRRAAQILELLGGSWRSLALGRWPLPLVAALGQGRLRHAELKRLLGYVTPRALALALRQVVAAGLIERAVLDGSPPAVVYGLTQAGEELSAVLQNLDRPFGGPAQ